MKRSLSRFLFFLFFTVWLAHPIVLHPNPSHHSCEYFHINRGWLIKLYCLMRSFCRWRQVGVFTRSQLVGGWHLFLSDWKAPSVSLLKEKTKQNKTTTQQQFGKHLISIDEKSECVVKKNKIKM